MPLYGVMKQTATAVPQADFATEKALQTLVENNLAAIFRCRFVATEFATGAQHAGRIDTLALSEEDNPVIIEYKKAVSSDLVTQSLFYLAWLDDHHGDFTVAAQRSLDAGVKIDWSAIRVICIAPSYKKYDLFAVRKMGANIELWTYKRYANDTLLLEQVRQDGEVEPAPGSGSRKRPASVASGAKPAQPKAAGNWSVETLLAGKPPKIRELFELAQEFMLSLDSAIEEVPRKNYVAYRTTQNIVCVEAMHGKLLLFLKLDPKKTAGPKGIWRDMTDIGHLATGDFMIQVRAVADLEAAKPFMRKAYETVGG